MSDETDLLPACASAPLLLDVPPNRRKLDVWKERHGVRMYHATPLTEWQAFRRADNGTWDHATADSEEAACFALAEKLRLTWLESVSQADCAIPATAEVLRLEAAALTALPPAP